MFSQTQANIFGNVQKQGSLYSCIKKKLESCFCVISSNL